MAQYIRPSFDLLKRWLPASCITADLCHQERCHSSTRHTYAHGRRLESTSKRACCCSCLFWRRSSASSDTEEAAAACAAASSSSTWKQRFITDKTPSSIGIVLGSLSGLPPAPPPAPPAPAVPGEDRQSTSSGCFCPSNESPTDSPGLKSNNPLRRHCCFCLPTDWPLSWNASGSCAIPSQPCTLCGATLHCPRYNHTSPRPPRP